MQIFDLQYFLMQQKYGTLFLQNPNCKNYNKALSVCINQTCEHSTFVCSKQDCSCFKQHSQCKLTQLTQIMQKIAYKNQKQTQKVSERLNLIIQIYDQIIQQFSEDRAQFTQLSELYGVEKQCRNFTSLLNEGKFAQINGKLTFKVYTQINQRQKSEIVFPNKSLLEQNRQSIKISFNMIRGILKKYHNYCLPIGLRSESEIISNIQFLKIKEYFIRPVAKFQLLFRGSQHLFNPVKFHKNCDGISNTLILVQSQQNEIIGGYTPLRWRSSDFPAYTYDSSGQSFLFSLTKNIKQSLYREKCTIMNDKNSGPMFGKEKLLKIANRVQTKQDKKIIFLGQSNMKYFKLFGKFDLYKIYPQKYIMLNIRKLIQCSIQLCLEACNVIKDAHENKNFEKYLKGQNDPFTDADLKVQTLIVRGLRYKFPELKIIGQESKDYQGQILFDEKSLKENILPQQVNINEQVPFQGACIWIDPIDGTKSFIKGDVFDCSVLIGLSFQKKAIVGIVALPYQKIQQQQIYNPKIIFGSVPSKVAYISQKNEYKILKIPQFNMNKQFIVARSSTNKNKAQDELVQRLKAKCVFIGGCGKKIMMVALNQIDLVIYMEFKTGKWDTCGPQAIIKSMGGFLTNVNKEDLKYQEIHKNATNQAFVCTLHEKFYLDAIENYK